MNCNDVETALPELARGSQDNPVLSKRLLLHASSCGNCANRLEQEQILQDSLSALQIEMQPEAAPPIVENQLLAEFRSHHRPATPLASITSSKLTARWILAAAAVLALVAIGLMLAAVQRTSRTAGNSIAKTAAPVDRTKEKPKEAAEKKAGALSTPAPETPRRRKLKPRRFYDAMASAQDNSNRRANDRANDSEVATEFFPMTASPALSEGDSGQILRVELPRRALMTFGLPFDPNRPDQRVKADVVLGSDGVARAIRFVK
ncbi:MAG TPA: hypothetical protein VKM94_01890 [Blastocatellia bacterium]|nr:hypothetical protein [Blastocatellia bacterium]